MELKVIFLKMYAKRRISIVNFLNYIQDNNVGMQRNAGNGGTGHGRKFLMGFSLVASGLEAGEFCRHPS